MEDSDDATTTTTRRRRRRDDDDTKHARLRRRPTFLTFSNDAVVTLATDVLATVVLATTLTPVKELVIVDMVVRSFARDDECGGSDACARGAPGRDVVTRVIDRSHRSIDRDRASTSMRVCIDRCVRSIEYHVASRVWPIRRARVRDRCVRSSSRSIDRSMRAIDRYRCRSMNTRIDACERRMRRRLGRHTATPLRRRRCFRRVSGAARGM